MRVVSVVRISVLLPSSKRRGRVLARLGGRAASSQGVGASHRHSVKLIQQPCQRAVRSKLAATYDCLEILKRKEKLCTADKEAQTFKAGENYHRVIQSQFNCTQRQNRSTKFLSTSVSKVKM